MEVNGSLEIFQSQSEMALESGTEASGTAAEMHSLAASLDKSLKHLLRASAPGQLNVDKEVLSVQNRLRDTLSGLLFLDFEFAASKDVEGSLWKAAHYRLIEDFRKKLSVAAKKDPGVAKVLAASFKAFLTDATSFYLAFINKLKDVYSLERVDDIVCKKLDVYATDGEGWEGGPVGSIIPQVTPEIQEKATLTVHKCLIYLGDLARYRELHSDKKEKRWSLSRNFYTLAVWLCPEIGNPFNQLAVIDTYEAQELSAVEHYIQSLSIQVPFQTALDNITVLLQKSRKRATDLVAQGKSLSATQAFLLMHGYLLLDKALDPYRQAEQHFMKTLSHDLETSLLPPSHLAKFLKITLGHAYLQSLAAQDGPSALANSLHSLVHDLVFRVLKAVSDDVLGQEQSLLVIKMYLRFLAASGSPIPAQTAGPLIALLQATSSKGVPNAFLLREDVELLGFAPFNPSNPRDSLETLVESAAEEKSIRGGQVLALAVQLSLTRPGLFTVTKKTATDGPGNLVFKAIAANHVSDVHPATATVLTEMEEEEGDEIVVYTGRKEAEPRQPARGGGLASAAITASSSFWTTSFVQDQARPPRATTHSSSSMIMGSKQDDMMESASDGVNTISFLGLNQQSPSVPGGRIARNDPRTTYSMSPFMHFGGNPSNSNPPPGLGQSMAATPVQAASSSGFPAPPGFSVFGQVPSPTTTDLNSPWTRSSLHAPAVSHTSDASFQMPPPPASSLTSNHSGMPTFQPLSWLNSMPQQQIQMHPQQHSHYPPPSHQQHPQQMAHGYHLGHPSTASSPAWFGQAERGAPLWPSASQPATPTSNQQQQQGSNGPSYFQPSMNFNAQWK